MSRHRVQHQLTFLVTICKTMKLQCVVNQAKNQPLTSHQFFKRGGILELPTASCGSVGWVMREGRSCLAFDPVARPLVLTVLSEAHVCSG